MRIKTLSAMAIVSILLIGCGETTEVTAESNQNRIESSKVSNIAMDNSVHKVEGEFKGYKVVVYTDAEIADKPSQSTKAIYGKINGESTASLLTINANYKDGDVFKVKVYKEDKLVGESDEEVLSGNTLEFSSIKI